MNCKQDIKVIICYGTGGQLREGKRQVQVSVSELNGKRRVGCIYLGENGFCNAPGSSEPNLAISRLSCVHLRPISKIIA